MSRPDAEECLERTDHDGPHVEVIVESTLFSRPPDRLWYLDRRFDASVCPLHGLCSDSGATAMPLAKVPSVADLNNAFAQKATKP